MLDEGPASMGLVYAMQAGLEPTAQLLRFGILSTLSAQQIVRFTVHVHTFSMSFMRHSMAPASVTQVTTVPIAPLIGVLTNVTVIARHMALV